MTGSIHPVALSVTKNCASHYRHDKEQSYDNQKSRVAQNLLVSTSIDSRGHEHLTNAQYTTPKGTADLYDLPGTIEKQPLKQEFKLDLDGAHSRHIKTGGREILYPKAQNLPVQTQAKQR